MSDHPDYYCHQQQLAIVEGDYTQWQEQTYSPITITEAIYPYFCSLANKVYLAHGASIVDLLNLLTGNIQQLYATALQDMTVNSGSLAGIYFTVIEPFYIVGDQHDILHIYKNAVEIQTTRFNEHFSNSPWLSPDGKWIILQNQANTTIRVLKGS